MVTHQLKSVVSDGPFIFDYGCPSSLTGLISITFYSDEYITPVQPTTGHVLFEISEDGFNYGTIDNGDIMFPLTNGYNRPNFKAFASHVKVTLTGVTGASHFVVRVHME